MSRVATVWLALVTALSASETRAAERSPTALSWVRAPGAERCADLKTITAAVDARLKRPAFVAAAEASVLIEASIEDDRANGTIRVRIIVLATGGEHLGRRDLQIEGQDCREATETAALAIALMIDPNALAGTEAEGTFTAAVASAESSAESPIEPAAPVVATTTPPQAPAPRPAPAAAPAPPRDPADNQRSLRVRLGLGALGSLGQLPEPTLGVLGAVRLSPHHRRYGVEVAYRYLAPREAEVRPDAGGHFSAMSIELAGFFPPVRKPRFELSVAAGAQVGTIAAHGYGFDVANAYEQSWIANGVLAADLAFALGASFSLLVRPSLELPVVRDRFEALRDGKTVLIFKPSAAVADVAIGLAFEP